VVRRGIPHFIDKYKKDFFAHFFKILEKESYRLGDNMPEMLPCFRLDFDQFTSIAANIAYDAAGISSADRTYTACFQFLA
jgi:hypothetical protein